MRCFKFSDVNLETDFLFLFLLGAKEIDIAATLEHIRDQRMDMVKTKVLKGFSKILNIYPGG